MVQNIKNFNIFDGGMPEYQVLSKETFLQNALPALTISY